ncbi:MAG: class I SAM-dependent methyltransferase [Lyngbya sp. HA4199-MV5]|jgi:ubiquinone/menaquinone biosynthesis C-methylase UbiE|nr:class I SAM-dependent methyltransferase [Lyngbya sp. HA4199-MV5]
MAENAQIQSRPNYGIDAPGLVRFFFSAGAVALAIFLVVLFSSLLGQILKIVVGTLSGIAATYLLGMGCFMLYGSKVMKLKDRDKLLDLVPWSGNERVLDVGCGRGLMLVGAAKRLTTGKAIGIDLWQQHDQANNSAAAALANAVTERVTERVEIKTADMRQLPFPDDYFDVVLSSWAVHNVEAEVDRKKALDEIVRVLKPNGRVVLSDIIHQAEYAHYFEHHGMTNVQLHNNAIRDFALKAVTFGSFAPSAVSACKRA